ncbi:spermatogenesis-associated protein 7 homolog isoform X1 [Scyliorhinus canicula]|uniref:spermatogenesis-associated protein 7 homolog isoform X1 n=2 Tax=Scyliorhinus canicula TaxID=7830 RepID=UPI0018F7CA02|nr:spermatogenesis-associated protein 7 homolog isoform X1 [Scyliorhinus canicula]
MTPFCIIKCTEGIIAGLQSAMIPKYSLMGPFKGHMCTKSSPFCLGSSCKLSTQFIIQDHMAVHYKNLLSTKAAVDSSMPKSMSTSIKYIDQQKRERLKKVVKKYQEETPLHPSTSQMNDRSVSLATTRFMDKDLMKRPFQDPQKKTFSGDILDKHSNQFTEEIQPFTPRTLKNTAKSFLSKYRYYKAPKKTQDNPGAAKMFQQNSSEANINRFTKMSPIPVHLVTDYSKWCKTQEQSPRTLARKGHRSTTVKSKLMAREDEMKYLQFLKEVTDDILIRGYHSNKILENVFQTHIERSKYHLSEGKLKNILQNLRNELQTDPAVNYSEHSTAAQKTWLLAKNIHRTHTPVR